MTWLEEHMATERMLGRYPTTRRSTMAQEHYPTGKDAAYQPSMPAREMERANALRAVSMPLDDLEKQLEVARERITNLSGLARRAADHLVGAEPEGPNDGAGHPPRPGKVGSLLDGAEYLHNCIGVLEQQIGRLAPLVTG